MKTIAAITFALAAVLAAAGQDLEIPKNELSLWGGYSPDSSTVVRVFGRFEDARFGTAGVRYSRRFRNSKVFNFKYTADLIPVAVVGFRDPFDGGRRKTAYGFGGSPIGLQTNFRPAKKVQPFIGLSGGMLYFDKRVPSARATRFQFTFEVGAGAEIRLNGGKALTVGYKYFHLSNADRGIDNPGTDNNLFYVGYTFFGS